MQKLTFFYVLALLILLMPFSCKKEDAGSVSGHVTAFDNQEPVEGARVYLRKYTYASHKDKNYHFDLNSSSQENRPWVTDSTTTDKNGYFRFDSPYPIVVYTNKENYHDVTHGLATNSLLQNNTENVVELQLVPYAWVKIKANNKSGAYKLLTYGADDKPYFLIVPQNTTGEILLPAFNGSFSSHYYLYKVNDELILPSSGNVSSFKVDCQYRDTTFLELEY